MWFDSAVSEVAKGNKMQIRSWKTSLGGAMAALGATLFAAGEFSWVTPSEVHAFKLVGFLIGSAGTFFGLLFARDNNVTSEQAGCSTTEKPK